jgi:hypothetical protein
MKKFLEVWIVKFSNIIEEKHVVLKAKGKK